MLKFILENLSHVAPILISGGIALLIIIERSAALHWGFPLKNMDGFFSRLRLLIMRDKLQDAIALCDRYRDKPVARVVREGIIRAHQPESLIVSGLEIVVATQTEKVQARTQFLSTIANVATLFGLLGTIMGLVQSFKAVGDASAQQRSAMLAAGISTAMNATMMGLAVAIPAMIAYAILMNKTNKIVAQIDQSAVRVMDLIQQRYYSSDSEKAELQLASNDEKEWGT